MFKKLLGSLLFAFAASFSASAWAQVVGYVHEVRGDVTLRDIGKPAAKPSIGDTFQQGANFTTAADGQVTIKFEDGQLASIAPNSQFIVTTYVFNKTRVADSNIVFNLARGGLRFVSGMIASTSREKFAVRTPTATAGVRGSDGNIALGGDGSIIASTSNGAVTLTVGGVTVTIPPGASSIAPPGGGAPGAPAPSGTIPIPPALAIVVNTVRIIAAANVPNNTPNNPAALAQAVRLAVLAVQNPNNAPLQAAARDAAIRSETANRALAPTLVTAGGAPPTPPATQIVLPPIIQQTSVLPTLPPVPLAPPPLPPLPAFIPPPVFITPPPGVVIPPPPPPVVQQPLAPPPGALPPGVLPPDAQLPPLPPFVPLPPPVLPPVLPPVQPPPCASPPCPT